MGRKPCPTIVRNLACIRIGIFIISYLHNIMRLFLKKKVFCPFCKKCLEGICTSRVYTVGHILSGILILLIKLIQPEKNTIEIHFVLKHFFLHLIAEGNCASKFKVAAAAIRLFRKEAPRNQFKGQ